MVIRDKVCVQGIIRDIRDELCEGKYFKTRISNSELEELIYLFFDVAEMDTSYNCEVEDDNSLFTYIFNNNGKKVEKKVYISGRDIEEVKGILDSINRYYTDTQDNAYQDLKLLSSTGIECYFKKVIHITEKKNYSDNIRKYTNLPDGTTQFTFAPAFNKSTSFYNLPENIRNDRTDLKNNVVETRNKTHKEEAIGKSDLAARFQKTCIALLVVTYDNRDVLKEIVEDYKKSFVWGNREKSIYLQKIIDQYRKSDIYDNVSGKERYVEMRVSPNNKPITSVSQNKKDHEKNTPHCIMLHGTAGTGKTTIINHFEYHEALECLEGLNKTLSEYHPIPVKIKLGNLKKENNVIKNAIGKTLSITDEQLEKLLQNGELHIYLDAVDEYLTINNDISIKSEIADFINTYTNCFIYVTGRKPENFPTKENCDAIRCQLGKMNDVEKESLIRAYAPNEDVAKIIIELRSRSSYDALFENPLFIKMMVSTVSSNKEIPKDETDLITSYLVSLFEREIEKTHDESISVDIMFELLNAIHPKNLNSSSDEYTELAPIYKKDIRLKFKEVADKYGLSKDFDTQKMILKFIDLNILEEKNNFFLTYSTLEYQNYFEYSEYYIYNV